MAPLSWLTFITGLAVYALVMWDVLKTTISMHGGGPLTNAIVKVANYLISAPPAKFDEDTNGSLRVRFFARYSALILTCALFATWFFGLALGLTLALASAPGGITESSGVGEITFLEQLYFISASVTTAGFGDYIPTSDAWRGYTILTAASGLVVTSLGISYVINLVGAVLDQRRLARSIVDLGSSQRDILAAFYDGESFAPFGNTLQSLADNVLGHVERHLAYPMIHYVRANDNRDCLPAAIALLDETLTVLLYSVPRERQPNLGTLFMARRALTAYLENLRDIYIDDTQTAPPWPDLAFLLSLWQIVPEQRERAVSPDQREALRRRRTLVRAAVQSQGLSWDGLVHSLRSEPDEALDASLLALVDGDAVVFDCD